MAGRARPKQRDTSKRFRITVRGRTLELSQHLTLNEKMAVRLGTGIPFEQFFVSETRIGEDTVAVLWWLARRKNGEPGLAWAKFANEWETITPDDLDVEEIDDDADEGANDPEG